MFEQGQLLRILVDNPESANVRQGDLVRVLDSFDVGTTEAFSYVPAEDYDRARADYDTADDILTQFWMGWSASYDLEGVNFEAVTESE